MSVESQKSQINWSESSKPCQRARSQFFKMEPIFTKPKSERTQKDIDLAVKTLKELSFFSAMQKDEIDLEELLVEFLNVMECETFKIGETVFNYRDKALKFYVILKGSVDIYVPKTEEEARKDILKLEDCIRKRIESLQKKNSTTQGLLFELNEETSNKLKMKQAELLLINFRSQHDQTKLEALDALLDYQAYFQINAEELTSKFKKVKTIGSGAYFGEIALSKNCARTATVIASSDLLVATLSKEDYKKTLVHFEKEFHEKINFFAKLIDLHPDQSSAVTKFCYGFKERKYRYGQNIFKQGEIPHEAFIVKQGEVQVFTREYLDPMDYSGENPILKAKKAQNQKLANLGPDNLLGENEALLNKPYHISAVSVSNDTVLYVISAKEFQSLKINYASTFEKITANHEAKSAYFTNRLQNIHSTKKIVIEMPQDSINSERRSPNALTQKDISQVHSPTFFAKRLKNIVLPKLPEKQTHQTGRKNPTDYSQLYQNYREESVGSLFSDFSIGTPLSHQGSFKSLPKTKGESASTSNDPTPKQSSKEKSTFGDYFNSLVAESEPGNIKSRVSRFIEKFNERKIKKAKTESVGPVIKSQKLFASSPYLRLKEKARKSKLVEVSKQPDSSNEIDSCDDQMQAKQKMKKQRCSILNHLK